MGIMEHPEETQEPITLTILANLMALNVFIELKYGEEGANLLAEIEEKVRETMKEDGL
jgi:hypothetical protein